MFQLALSRFLFPVLSCHVFSTHARLLFHPPSFILQHSFNLSLSWQEISRGNIGWFNLWLYHARGHTAKPYAWPHKWMLGPFSLSTQDKLQVDYCWCGSWLTWHCSMSGIPETCVSRRPPFAPLDNSLALFPGSSPCSDCSLILMGCTEIRENPQVPSRNSFQRCKRMCTVTVVLLFLVRLYDNIWPLFAHEDTKQRRIPTFHH